ncbi:MAG: OmpA family protein [Deltaproteobacteria bacterium]|nr:OmpA family protein [Deltaproteobacteria bacterium]
MGATLLFLWGCAGAVQAKVERVPPPPVPQPAEPAAGEQASAQGDVDRCPDEEEDGLPPKPNDGCKTTDPDGDGVVGSADQCPDEGETKNDYRDDDGCPDELPAVYLAGNQIQIRDKALEFAGTILSAAAAGLAGDVANLLKEHSDIELLEVGVHTAGSGSGPASLMYAEARARAVVNALTKAGIAADRLRAKGYGGSCKLDAGRVDLTVVRRAGKDTGADLGCAEASH